jgi:hypothetical protein
MWASFWAWLTEVAVRLWGWYGSQPVAKPSTEAASPVPDEKVEDVCAAIEESELWAELYDRDRKGL